MDPPTGEEEKQDKAALETLLFFQSVRPATLNSHALQGGLHSLCVETVTLKMKLKPTSSPWP